MNQPTTTDKLTGYYISKGYGLKEAYRMAIAYSGFQSKNLPKS